MKAKHRIHSFRATGKGRMWRTQTLVLKGHSLIKGDANETNVKTIYHELPLNN